MVIRTACAALVLVAGSALAGDSVPICPGLTLVTAVSQSNGDYESIKTVESVSANGHRLKYSSEAPDNDIFSTTPGGTHKTTVYRVVRNEDLRSGTIYQQVFLEKSDELIPGATSIGTSAAVLDALKKSGKAKIGLSAAFAAGALTADREKRPNYYDYIQPVTLHRVESTDVPVRVIVNDKPVNLPAVHAAGEFQGEKSEFFFLDDPGNPLTLMFRTGIGAIKPMDPANADMCKTIRESGGSSNQCLPKGGDRDTLRVVKIAYHCAADAGSLEQQLAATGHADIYSIYFSFNSADIRDASEPTLKEIADILRKHPGWRLKVNGHTDSVGTEKTNLPLSQRRADAVRAALGKRYAIDPKRLEAHGYGATQPRDTNDTIDGRARNRRVELVRM